MLALSVGIRDMEGEDDFSNLIATARIIGHRWPRRMFFPGDDAALFT